MVGLLQSFREEYLRSVFEQPGGFPDIRPEMADVTRTGRRKLGKKRPTGQSG